MAFHLLFVFPFSRKLHIVLTWAESRCFYKMVAQNMLHKFEQLGRYQNKNLEFVDGCQCKQMP